MSYSVDTSALMNAWNRHYPPDVFGGVWKRIDDLIDDGRFLAVDPVLDELEKQDDDLIAWAAARKRMFVPLEPAIQLRAKEVVNDSRR